MNFSKLFVGLPLLALMACDVPAVSSSAQNEAKFRALSAVAGTQTVVTGKTSLGPNARKLLKEFRDSGVYHGALAVPAGVDGAAWWNGMSSLASAQKAALAECAWAFRTASCTIHAVTVPVDSNGKQLSNVGHSAESRDTLLKMYRDTGTGLFGALAETEFGVWWVSWNYDSMEQAKTAALAGCGRTNAEARASLNPGLYSALAAELDMTCKVTLTFAP